MPRKPHANDVLARARELLERQTPQPVAAPHLRVVDEAEEPTASDLSAEQTETAIQKLYAPTADAVRFPYPSVHAMVGRTSPGRLMFVAANTGQGKTTFLLDALDRWAEAGVAIDYLGTEQEPDELRTKWACLRADVPPGVAINLEWDEWPDGELWQERVAEELGKLDDAYRDQIVFSPEKFITLSRIEAAARQAQRRGAHMLIVDHVDRIDVEPKDGNEFLAVKKLIRRLKELARDHRLVMLVASQMNREGRKGDRLANYRPPQLHHMQGGGTKEHEADVVLGLWRPIRDRQPDESPKEYAAMLKSATAGNLKPADFTEPNTMAVVLLKHRTWGNREGERTKLHVQHGRITEISERDRHATTSHGIRRSTPV